MQSRVFLAGIIFVLFVAGGLFAAEADSLLAQGDALAKQHRTREALAVFEKANSLSPANAEILSRLSEQYSDLTDSEKSEKPARQSLEFALQAVKAASDNFRAHVDLAIAYGKLTDFTDNKTKLEYSKLIKKEAETALRLDPNNALAAHVLGRWHLGIASLNPMLKAMARMIYGGMPPASMEEAVSLLKKAVDLEPSSILYRHELAKAYSKNGQSQLARLQWEQMVLLHPSDKEDETALQEARAAIHRR
jgi:tetratricopeptide (TPR) repeat protein